MDRNFAVRYRLYGRECLGEGNMRMIELGQQFGAHVKFPGSGGAILGLASPETDMVRMRRFH